MHDGQVATSVDLVRSLVAEQMPTWSDLPVTPLAAFGTDHALYRLGPDLLVRLPIIDWAVDQVASDWRWMPVLGPGWWSSASPVVRRSRRGGRRPDPGLGTARRRGSA
jgi:aminoglycoside phosphotransferase (APT) family kinase protein